MQNAAAPTAPAVVTVTIQPRPLVTHRVVIRATGAALRVTADIDKPTFGQPNLYRDQLCEFPSEETAQIALDYVRMRTAIGHTLRGSDQLVIDTQVWAGLNQLQENAVLCRVRDSIAWLGWTQMQDALTNVRRSFLGLDRRAL